MESMIERVAKSQCEFDGRPWLSMPKGERDRYKERAVLAIKAMREPSKAMEIAVSAQWGRRTWSQYSDLIDAALKD